MKPMLKFCAISAFLWATSASGKDALSDLKTSGYGVSVTREVNVHDYAGLDQLKNRDRATVRVLVTTETLSPDAETYAIAEALYDGLKTRYPRAEFRVGGNADNEVFAKSVHEGFDYVGVVGTNTLSKDYKYDETIYGSTSDGVKCTPSSFDKSVSCKETGSTPVPVGSRASTRSIYTDIFFITFAAATELRPAWEGGTYKPKVSIDKRMSHMFVVMRYGDSEASFCENSSSAQALLARLVATDVTLSRPNKIEFHAKPKKLGCAD